MHQVSIEEATRQLPGLLAEVSHGVEVVIMQDDQPIAKLVAAHPPKAQRQFGSAHGLLTVPADFDAPLTDFAEYRA